MKSKSMAATSKFHNNFLTQFLTASKNEDEIDIEKDSRQSKELKASKIFNEYREEKNFVNEKKPMRLSCIETASNFKPNNIYPINTNAHKKSVGGSLQLQINKKSVSSSTFYTPIYQSNDKVKRTKGKLDMTNISNATIGSKKKTFSLNKLENSLTGGTGLGTINLLQPLRSNGIKSLVSPVHKLNLRTPKSPVRKFYITYMIL
jgi:hypothetical protein